MAKLFVGNLPYTMTESDLQEMFASHGAIESVAVITDRDTGRSKGFGFVEFSSDDEANAAIEALNNSEVQGRRIVVNIARPLKDRPPRRDFDKRY